MSVVANVAINVDAANAIQQLDRIKAAAGQSEKGLNGASGAAAGFGASLTAALGPIIGVTSALAALGKSLTVFQGRETDVAVLKAGLKGLVTDVDASAAALEKLGDEFGKTTLFSEEDFTRGAQLLTSFRSIAVSNYEEVINTAGNVAQVMRTDVNGSLLQLAKALQDPVLGLSALSRSGIQFNETQKETIKSMVAVGNVADAQKLILRELQTQYQEAAKVAGKTGLAAALDTLAEVANDVFNAIGNIFSPLATQAATKFTSALKQVEAAMPQVQAAVMALMTPLGAIADVVLPAVSGAFKFVLQNIQAIIQVATFFGTFVGVLNAITLATKAWAAATTVLGTAQKVAAVAAAALQAMSGPAGIAKVIAATATATGASYALGKAMDSAAKKITAVKGETDLTAQSAREMLKNYSLTPPAIASAEGKAKDLQAAQKAISDEIKHQNDLIKGQLNIESQRVSQSASLVQARSQAEIAVNNLLIDRLENELKSTEHARERTGIIKQIYDLEVKNARATYEATAAQIQSQVRLLELAVKEQRIKAVQLDVERNLLAARGANTTEIERAIALQNQAILLAEENVYFARHIADEQLQGAKAVYDSAVYAAELKAQTAGAAKEASSYTANMNQAAVATKKVDDALKSAEIRAANASFIVSLQEGDLTAAEKALDFNLKLAQARTTTERTLNDILIERLQTEYESEKRLSARRSIINEIQRVEKANAKLAYNATQAQIKQQLQLAELAVIQQQLKMASLEVDLMKSRQAGEDVTAQLRAIQLQEKVIDLTMENVKQTRILANEQERVANATYKAAVNAAAAKQSAAYATTDAEYSSRSSERRAAVMAKYSSNDETSKMNFPDAQVNIQTGPVMQMDGTNYVTQRDLMNATQSAARQGAGMALSRLERDPATRRRIGVIR